MSEKIFFHYLLGGIISLITITNPLSKIPLFVTLTAQASEDERKALARKACSYAFLIMAISLFAGALILEFFGISYGALRVAGGITVSVVGFRMLFGNQASYTSSNGEHKNVAFFPLALPSISGPGVIAVVIGISTEIAELKRFSDKALAYSGTVLGILLTCVAVWLTLRSARLVQQGIGAEGMEAMSRMMGFLLICVGVQFIGSGIHTFVHSF